MTVVDARVASVDCLHLAVLLSPCSSLPVRQTALSRAHPMEGSCLRTHRVFFVIPVWLELRSWVDSLYIICYAISPVVPELGKVSWSQNTTTVSRVHALLLRLSTMAAVIA